MSERWRIIQGSFALMVAFTIAVWPLVDEKLFIVWLLGYGIWVGLTFSIHSGRFLVDWRDR